MSTQPDLDSLNAQRITEKILDLAALGWAVEKTEARGLPVPSYDELHHMADEWKASL